MNRISVIAQTADVQHPPQNDLLRGAAAIASFLLDDPKQKRVVYHMFEKGRLPAFRLGKRIYARKSSLLAWIERLEAQHEEKACVTRQTT